MDLHEQELATLNFVIDSRESTAADVAIAQQRKLKLVALRRLFQLEESFRSGHGVVLANKKVTYAKDALRTITDHETSLLEAELEEAEISKGEEDQRKVELDQERLGDARFAYFSKQAKNVNSD